MSEVTAVPLRPVSKSGVTTLWIGVAVLLAAGIGGAMWSTETARNAALPADVFLAKNARQSGVVTTASGLEYKVIEPGAGPKPTANDAVQIDYDGRFTSGELFDSSTRHNGPVLMPVAGNVPGFTEALQLMPRGAKYRIWISPQLGYGPEGQRGIPANSVLVFDVTMHDFGPIPAGAMPGM